MLRLLLVAVLLTTTGCFSINTDHDRFLRHEITQTEGCWTDNGARKCVYGPLDDERLPGYQFGPLYSGPVILGTQSRIVSCHTTGSLTTCY